VSERRACRVVRQWRGTQRYLPLRRTDEDQLTQAILALAGKYGRYGYRRITALLQSAGRQVGKDRVQRPALGGEGPRYAAHIVRYAGAPSVALVPRILEHNYAQAGGWVQNCSILTTTPNAVTSAVHDRMPVILDPDSYDLWLDPGMMDVIYGVRTAEALRCSSYAVNTRINHVANDDEECSQPCGVCRDSESTLLVT
jgi:hypothetical protein